jgi:hypothetical protein
VLVEAGTASGREPTADVEIRSYLGTFLTERGVSLGAEDERGFSMRLLHFRRTFVEKLFAIHAKVEIFKRTARPIGSYARHSYDLSQLATRPEVIEMLASDEYATIKADYDAISREHFDQSYIPPDDMRFATSQALFRRARSARPWVRSTRCSAVSCASERIRLGRMFSRASNTCANGCRQGYESFASLRQADQKEDHSRARRPCACLGQKAPV